MGPIHFSSIPFEHRIVDILHCLMHLVNTFRNISEELADNAGLIEEYADAMNNEAKANMRNIWVEGAGREKEEGDTRHHDFNGPECKGFIAMFDQHFAPVFKTVNGGEAEQVYSYVRR